MTKLVATLMGGFVLLTQSLAVGTDRPLVAQAQGQAPATSSEKAPPAKSAANVTTVRGTISAIDKDAGTVTLKGPRGRTVTIDVKDRSKFDVIKVGDPVVATYVEAMAVRLQKSGTATPGVSVQESRATSKPGETPAGAVGREVTATVTITAIDKKAKSVTVKGPQGNTETIKVKDPKNLEGVKVGDLIEITYVQALAVSLAQPK